MLPVIVCYNKLSGGDMDYETIGEIKYFLSDKDRLHLSVFDKKTELKLLESAITKSKYSFMIAETQLHLLSELGFERSDNNLNETTSQFMERFKIKNTFNILFRRHKKNKIIELYFSDFEFMSEGHRFYYVSLKSVQDSELSLGNGKMGFLYHYATQYDARPTLIFKHVGDFIEKTVSDHRYNSYASKMKTYYPNNSDIDTSFYLEEACFDEQNIANSLTYSVLGKRMGFSAIKKLIPDIYLDMDALAKLKIKIDDSYAQLIKIMIYS